MKKEVLLTIEDVSSTSFTLIRVLFKCVFTLTIFGFYHYSKIFSPKR